MPVPKVLTNEEIEKLPIRRLRQNSGEEIMVRYDEKNGQLYMPDGEGGYLMAKLNPKQESEPAPSTGPAPSEEGTKEGPKEKDGRKKKRREPKDQPEGSSAEKKPLTVKQKQGIAIGVGVFIMLIYLLLTSGLFSGNSGDDPSPELETTEPIVDVAGLAASAKYEVIVLTRNVFKGDILTEEDLTTCVLTKAEYAACGGAYTADCIPAVVGMEMTQFQPFGTILLYSSCSVNSGYSTSPYAKLDGGLTYLDVPWTVEIKDIGNFLPGDYVYLEIRVDTSESQRNPSDSTSVGGMEYSSSVTASTTTEIYRFPKIQVADLVDKDKGSVYAQFSALFSVPSGFLPSVMRSEYDANTISKLMPSYYRFVITQEQAEIIGTLSPANSVCSMKLLNEAQDPPVDNYRVLVKNIVSLIQRRIAEIEQELAAEGGQ